MSRVIAPEGPDLGGRVPRSRWPSWTPAGLSTGTAIAPGWLCALALALAPAAVPGAGRVPLDAPQIVDPVPLDGSVSLLQGSALTHSRARLAAGGRAVAGVGADGVAQLVIRLPATQVGEKLQVSIETRDAQGDRCQLATATDCGLVFDPVHPPDDLYGTVSQSMVTVSAYAPPSGGAPIAVLAYRAPLDFVRQDAPDTEDATRLARSVVLDVQSDVRGAQPPVALAIARPPVLLVHGNWSDPAGSFGALVPPLWPPVHQPDEDHVFWVGTLDYSPVLADGIARSAHLVFGQALDAVDDWRRTQDSAVAQFDAVGYSMGGLVVRQLALESGKAGYFAPRDFARGLLHKLLAADTPHLGSPFASNLDASGPFCKDAFRQAGNAVGQNIRDMEPDSAFLHKLNQPSLALHARVTAIEGRANEALTRWTEANWSRSALLPLCRSLLPHGGFDQLFDGNPNDLIVAEDSQLGAGLVIGADRLQALVRTPAVHAVDSVVFVIGPSVLGWRVTDEVSNVRVVADPAEGAAATAALVQLLNTPAGSPAWLPMVP